MTNVTVLVIPTGIQAGNDPTTFRLEVTWFRAPASLRPGLLVLLNNNDRVRQWEQAVVSAVVAEMASLGLMASPDEVRVVLQLN